MTAYYNEFDPFAAATLRELIKAGHIAPGIVDERSIEDVTAGDISGFDQCHFFAGFGVWSHALRRAGWSDNRRVWTASCPCQPFSAAGQGVGFADERHLWPAFYHLVTQCRPDVIYGEQVASKGAGPWIDLVHTDMEAMGYAFGAVPFPSAGIGAPHIRDRLYWVAHTDQHGRGAQPLPELPNAKHNTESCGSVGWLEHPRQYDDASQVETASNGQSQSDRPANIAGGSGVSFSRLAVAGSERHDGGGITGPTGATISGRAAIAGHSAFTHGVDDPQSLRPGLCDPANIRSTDGKIDVPANASNCESDEPFGQRFAAPTTGPTNGHWRDADWLCCRDGKWRPVEPGTFPLVDGAPARVGRLRGYGNAINAQAAQVFMECTL